MERYPKPNGVVGGSIPSCEIFSLLDEKTFVGWLAPPMFQKKPNRALLRVEHEEHSLPTSRSGEHATLSYFNHGEVTPLSS